MNAMNKEPIQPKPARNIYVKLRDRDVGDICSLDHCLNEMFVDNNNKIYRVSTQRFHVS
jgi:hypothetical protein